MNPPRIDCPGVDFTLGALLSDIPHDGALVGRVGQEPVLVSRCEGRVFAISGKCTHYGAPLAKGLIGAGVVRCPWHHACFDLRTGVALAAPAFDALDTWKVEIEGDRFFVRNRQEALPAAPARARRPGEPGSIVIIGGGAAGFSAAEMLRRLGYGGALTMLSADNTSPCDRPNLSKDYLAGAAPEGWIPLKNDDFYKQHAIDLRLGFEATAIDTDTRQVVTASGKRFRFEALLLATGAEPVRLSTPGFDRHNVYTLRSLKDARAIIAASGRAQKAAVIGASFIGLEVAASLRARGLEVFVVAPDEVPMERVLGSGLGGYVRTLHEENGVIFRLKQTALALDGRRLSLSGGETLDVDFVVQGVGVRPRTELAGAAGIRLDRGVLVDQYLETSVKGIFAAGDIARYPDPHTGDLIRVEHWVAAERQGQAVAMSLLGVPQRFDATPFFWSKHYKHSIRYVGHAPSWDAIEIDGEPAAGDCTVRYFKGGRLVAAASLGRDIENLHVERELELAL